MLLIIKGSLSVPRCGRALTAISGGAPCFKYDCMTNAHLGSLMRVRSFPSEKVPAPPSPNCMFDSSSSSFPEQNRAIFSARLSASSPRSSTIGAKPFNARSNAQNIPHGPKPTTTGRGDFDAHDFIFSGYPSVTNSSVFSLRASGIF
ncbi:hypothetical protein SDC9_199857 [bioreactor metagenome]|uniref:Uncharacterized protein n=1 Tax=bioreactor metagenome TaxID=1076179 RepID=A0A645ILN1_9ZZZZ